MKNLKIALIILAIFLIPLIAMAKFCIYCGEKNLDDAVYCIKCGKKFPAAAQKSTDERKFNNYSISKKEFDIIKKRENGASYFSYFSFMKIKNKFAVSEVTDKNFNAQIQPGDLIVSVSDTPVVDFDTDKMSNALNQNKKLKIQFYRESDKKSFDLEFPPAESNDTGIHFIKKTKTAAAYRISSINSLTPAAFEEAIKKTDSENISGIILDLRSCIGFSDSKPVLEMLQLLIPEGEKLGAESKSDNTKEEYYSKKMPVTYMPVTLIVDETVSGAAEFFAMSLIKNQRAIAAGSATAGAPFLIDWKKEDGASDNTEKKPAADESKKGGNNKNSDSKDSGVYINYIKSFLVPADDKDIPEKGIQAQRQIGQNIDPQKWVDTLLSNQPENKKN